MTVLACIYMPWAFNHFLAHAHLPKSSFPRRNGTTDIILLHTTLHTRYLFYKPYGGLAQWISMQTSSGLSLGSIFAIYTSLLWFLCNIYLIIIGYSDVVPSLGVTVMVVSNCGMDCGLDSEERYQASIQGCMCSGDFSASQGHMDTAEPWKRDARFNISLNKATNYAQSWRSQ